MKRLLRLGAVLIVGAFAVMLVRAVRVPARAPVAATPAALVMVDSTLAAQRLSGAVKFATVSRGDGQPIDSVAFVGFHNFLRESFPRVHSTLRREVVSKYSLLFTWPGVDTTAAPVIVMGHMDVVPVPVENLKDWMHGPFSGDIADGYVWGRGTLDDKTTVLAALEAVEGLLAKGVRPARTVYFTFAHDEELVGSGGARTMVDMLVARGVKPAMVIDEGGILANGLVPGWKGRAAVVGIAEKGYLSLRLRSRAVGGHSSMPGARTAIGALSRAIAMLESHPFPDDIDGPTRDMIDAMTPYVSFGQRLALSNLWITKSVVMKLLKESPSSAAMLHTTTSPTMITAGIKDNVLPPEATAIVNFRIRPGESVATVTARVRELVNDTLISIAPTDTVRNEPSPVSDIASPAYQLIASTIREMAPGEQVAVLPYLVVGGTDARLWGPHSSNVYRFLPIPMGNGDFERMHGLNERVAVKDYASAVGFFARLLNGLDRLK